jgi:uncharacterized membrane protein
MQNSVTPTSKVERIPSKDSQSEIQVAMYSGPIPSSSELARYETVQIGLADRLVKMAEKEQEFLHAIHMENQNRQNKQQNNNFTLASRAQILSFSTAIAFVASSVYLVTNGHTIASLITGITGLSLLIASYWKFQEKPKQTAIQQKPPVKKRK